MAKKSSLLKRTTCMQIERAREMHATSACKQPLQQLQLDKCHMHLQLVPYS